MSTLLQELAALTDQDTQTVNVNRLTTTQKSVLLSIYAAPTPETAYDATTGADNAAASKQSLRTLGLIVVDDVNGRAGVTDKGQEALANNNLIDDVGQLTDEGQKVLDQSEAVKADFENATESFSILKKLI